MARVLIENLFKTFKEPKGQDICAVSNVNLVIEDKEFLVLVGPSGSGKSTTLRLIAGLEKITRGTISIDGRVANDLAPKDRDIAMVFQNYALYPHMSVFDNLAFGLKLRRYPKAEIDQRVEDAAEILGLMPCLDNLNPHARFLDRFGDSGHFFGSAGFASSASSFLKSSRVRSASRSVSFFMCAAFL